MMEFPRIPSVTICGAPGSNNENCILTFYRANTSSSYIHIKATDIGGQSLEWIITPQKLQAILAIVTENWE